MTDQMGNAQTPNSRPASIQPPASPTTDAQPSPTINVQLGGGRGWNILVTLLLVAGMTVIGYQLSLGPLADIVATGISIFITTLVGLMFKAGILRLPEKKSDDDLAFTKSTLRRIYDEIQLAIANSSILRLVLFALIQAAGFLLLRAAVGFALGLMTSLWMAIGMGLVLGGVIVAQEQILAWIRVFHTRKGQKK